MDGDCHVPSQDTSVTDTFSPVSKDSSIHSHGEKIKMLNSTPNGYGDVPNHKSKSESHHKKHHDGSKSHSDSKHSSDHHKRKDGDISKHKDKHSHSSKPKDSSSVSKDHNKIHSSKPNDTSQSKEHSHNKEKKHHSSEKAKDSSGKSHSDHSKHVREGDKVKKEHRVSDEKPKLDNFKENNKIKDGKVKDKHHKDLKDKSLKDKNKEEKHRDKDSEKHKDPSIAKDPSATKDLLKHKEQKHKELKDKIKSEGHKDRPKDKIKDSSEKKSDSTKERPKLSSPVKSSEDHRMDRSMEKKSPMKESVSVKVNEAPSPTRFKEEPLSPRVKEEPLSDDDVPLSARTAKETQRVSKSIKREKEDESDDEPLSSRAEKVKKVKTEAIQKKRKAPDDDDEDYDYKKPVKKVKKEKEKKPVRVQSVTETASPKKRGKKEDEQEVWKWWEEEKLEEGVKWKTLQHNGPVFAPPYERVPKNVKFYYDGKHMELSEVTEEVAGFYGRMLDHDYTTKEVFNTNFFKDWKKVMTPEEKAIITDLRKCNFNAFNDYYKMKSEERKAMTKEEKQKLKEQNEELTQKYGYCIIDGHRQKIGNFKIEPPGLFRGRGEHPKMGMLKRRVQAEDIIINLGKTAPIPEAPEGHKWKEVRHDNTVTWLASWNENILNSTKYIMLNPSSKLKGEKDWQKYETARKLKNYADKIRQTYTADFKSKEMKVRQRAVALYFIDKLALRAGNEKDEDTADTVGCCSLRVEHITLHEEKDGMQYVVDFDFLGKDSIRYENSVPVERRAFKNVKLFMENKQPGDDLFDRLNTGILNKYLNELMEGLTAKVFRTYNASKTLQEQLDLLTQPDMSVPEKLLAYNRANRAVAVLCNHQRAVPKGFSKSMENLKGKMDEKKAQVKECQKEVKSLKKAYKDSSTSKDKMLYDKKKKRLQQLEDQLKKLEVQATDKEENKQIALGTSKLNYLDPRISVAWCKKWEVPIEKIYNRTQRDKFRWAIEMAGPDYVF